jgi:putative transposase
MSHTERAKYLTDLTDEQWQILRRPLPPCSRPGAPQRICRRSVLDAIIFAVRSGCPRRLLPHEFPNWKTVYGIFLRWRNDGTWQRIHHTLQDMLRRRLGRRGPLFCVIARRAALPSGASTPFRVDRPWRNRYTPDVFREIQDGFSRRN